MRGVYMLRTFVLLSVSVFILLMEWIMTVIAQAKNYGVSFWRRNMIRRWIFASIERAGVSANRFGEYLRGLQTRLQCRIAYDTISKPMKRRYRELTARGRGAG
jgi:hypothetical protein